MSDFDAPLANVLGELLLTVCGAAPVEPDAPLTWLMLSDTHSDTLRAAPCEGDAGYIKIRQIIARGLRLVNLRGF
jgi:hypothetical protein